MSRRNKTLERLERLESEFLELLLPVLSSVVLGRKDDAFLSSKLLPKSWPQTLQSKSADDLAERAENLLDIYSRLSLPTSDTPANLYLAAACACYDLSDHHRAAPDGFASKLLADLAALRS